MKEADAELARLPRLHPPRHLDELVEQRALAALAVKRAQLANGSGPSATPVLTCSMPKARLQR